MSFDNSQINTNISPIFFALLSISFNLPLQK